MTSKFGERTNTRYVGSFLPTTPISIKTTRPSDWPTLTEPSSSENKFVGLLAVYNTGANAVAVLADTSSGTYTVNWGDGTSSSGVTKNTSVSHQYTYSSLSSTVTSEGYKTAIVTITPDSGNFTKVNLQQRPTQYTYAVLTETNWLEVLIAGPSITSISIGTAGTTAGVASIRKAYILSSALSGTSASSLFQNCYSLEDVKFETSGTITSTSQMFTNCYSLEYAPVFNTSSVTTMSSMFSGCRSLKKAPLMNTSSVTNMVSMFNGCYDLEYVPLYNTSIVTSMASMFASCAALKSVPLFNTASVTSMSSMFSGCGNLKKVPLFNTQSVNNMSGMFTGCYFLKSVPLFNTASVTSMDTMFSACSSLESIPLFNTNSLTSMASMFTGCFSLKYVPELNTSSVTTMTTMYSQCASLNIVGPLISRSVTSGNFTTIWGSPTQTNTVSSAVFIGTRFSISYANLRLSDNELNAIYSNLADNNAYTVTAASWASNIATYTIGTHYMAVGQFVTVTGATPTGYNVTNAVVTAVTSTTFSVAMASNPGTWTSGGSIAANAGQTITVTNNFGTTSDTISIATNKNWAVSG